MLATITMPPMARIGAYRTIRMSMIDIIWICCTSFVARVISDAAENLCTSASEKAMTLRKSSLRNSRPIFAPVRAATRPTQAEMTMPSSTKPIIFNPVISRYSICMDPTSYPSASYSAWAATRPTWDTRSSAMSSWASP